MNVFFLDYRHFRDDAWPNLVNVLKIKKVFSFVEVSSFPTICSGRAQVYVKTNTEDFETKIAYNIANTPKKRIYTPDGDYLGYDDLDLFSKSRWNSPENNIENTDDPNILVLGTIIRSTDGHSKSVYFNDPSTTSNRDIGCDIASHTLNILKKHLQSDKYKERICFWLTDVITDTDFVTTGKRWVIRPTLLHFLSMELHKKFPNVYQFEKDDQEGKYVISNLFSDSYYKERRKWQQKYEREKVYAEECASFKESLHSGISWEDEVREMNEQFWNECGDAINEL